jgi:hypothetical protein
MKRLLIALTIIVIFTTSAFAGSSVYPDPTTLTSVGNIGSISSTVETLWQDPTEPPLVLYFTQALGGPTTLSNAVAIDDYDVVIEDTTDFSATDYVGVFSGVSGEGRFYFANIVSIVGNTLTMDTPFDFAYQGGDPIIPVTRNLAVDGSSTEQEFCIQVGGAATPITVDVTRILIVGECSAAPEFTDFCGIEGGLTRGIVLRKVDGDTRNYWNIKTNLDLANIAFDYEPYLAVNPGQGVNAITARYTWAGPDKHGTAVRLNAADKLCAIIQDDLTTEVRLKIIAEGHLVAD